MDMSRIEAVHGDITVQDTDAIVNAANRRARRRWRGGRRHPPRRGRRASCSAACAALGGCEPGEAKATPGFALAARWIIHTVGPVWGGGTRGEAEVLASCYRRSLEVADELGARSVAFPAISTGVYGYPPELAAQVALSHRHARATRPVELVRLVAFDRRHLRPLPHLARRLTLDYGA